MNKWDFFHDDFVILAIDKVIFAGLIFDDSELTIDIIRKLVIVAIKVIFSNIEQYCDMGTKSADII